MLGYQLNLLALTIGLIFCKLKDFSNCLMWCHRYMAFEPTFWSASIILTLNKIAACRNLQISQSYANYNLVYYSDLNNVVEIFLNYVHAGVDNSDIFSFGFKLLHCIYYNLFYSFLKFQSIWGGDNPNHPLSWPTILLIWL